MAQTRCTPEWLPANLNDAQEDGLACVICGADYLTDNAPHVPVGRSKTGSQVFACSDGRDCMVPAAEAMLAARAEVEGWDAVNARVTAKLEELGLR
ncbi:hypothetical protein [Amycolatopsis sp. cmx-4-68]|uniref:hypothetical protein n=1 Tax=Amycolatopsis sp. cmx-4-68 TaxID=2790938 RepID=UPI0039790B05